MFTAAGKKLLNPQPLRQTTYSFSAGPLLYVTPLINGDLVFL